MKIYKISSGEFSDDQIKDAIENYTGKKIKGGLGDKNDISKFTFSTIKKGIKVELEHTSDLDTAIEIVVDHLTEDEEYYKKLSKMEQKAKDIMKFIKIADHTLDDTLNETLTRKLSFLIDKFLDAGGTIKEIKDNEGKKVILTLLGETKNYARTPEQLVEQLETELKKLEPVWVDKKTQGEPQTL